VDNDVTTYDALISASPLVQRIVSQEIADTVFSCNESTVGALAPVWRENAKKNMELFRKHGSLVDSFHGFGTNRAVIGVGAGPSFNKNKRMLKHIFDCNIQFGLKDQPFIIVASNKQFRPLVEMGIYPHFVMLVDAGKALYPQLCGKGVPKFAQQSILITGLHADHRTLKEWDKRGGQICFYLIGDEVDQEYFRKETGQNPNRVHIQQGGNVLNTLWVLSHRVLGASTYIMVGNDLAFKYSDDKAEREASFYADGDYRLNILNRRDEAKDKMAWMGFDLKECSLAPGKYLYDLSPIGISKQMWVYKTWLEVQAAVWADRHKFFIFNASEAGSLGVLAREHNEKAMNERGNWFMIDELLPSRWLTTSLYKASQMFLEARKCLIRNQGRGAGHVISLPA
jgi:hypothetical protein